MSGLGLRYWKHPPTVRIRVKDTKLTLMRRKETSELINLKKKTNYKMKLSKSENSVNSGGDGLFSTQFDIIAVGQG